MSEGHPIVCHRCGSTHVEPEQFLSGDPVLCVHGHMLVDCPDFMTAREACRAAGGDPPCHTG